MFLWWDYKMSMQQIVHLLHHSTWIHHGCRLALVLEHKHCYVHMLAKWYRWVYHIQSKSQSLWIHKNVQVELIKIIIRCWSLLIKITFNAVHEIPPSYKPGTALHVYVVPLSSIIQYMYICTSSTCTCTLVFGIWNSSVFIMQHTAYFNVVFVFPCTVYVCSFHAGSRAAVDHLHVTGQLLFPTAAVRVQVGSVVPVWVRLEHVRSTTVCSV